MYHAVIDAPFGRVGIRTSHGGMAAGQSQPEILKEVVYLPPRTALRAPETALAQRTAQQIERYLERPVSAFDLPLDAVGTAFQQRVWQAISEIPCGTVRTYGQLARALGSAPRAVGQACGSNYFPLLIPCHRVVASSGIGGFSHHGEDGYFRDIKRWLLAHEGVKY
jgi:methylated-DNA-[protein]-cysteine S-methyltransferase